MREPTRLPSVATDAPRVLDYLYRQHLFTDRRRSAPEPVYQFHALFREVAATPLPTSLEGSPTAALPPPGAPADEQTVAESETEVTFRRASTVSLRWIPTASDGPLLVTARVKV